jgi:hypothetical protein
MKKIILTESDITKIVRKSIQNKLNEDKFSVEPEVSRQPRETEIDRLFGKYTYHVPDDVIRYMRKNPALIVKRLLDIYGEDKLMDYVDMARNPKEMDMRLDNDALRDELGEEEDFKDRLRNSLEKRFSGDEKEKPTSPLDSLFNSEDNDELYEESPDTNKDGKISKKELHKHFDLDGDGTVTPKEYDKHIKDHIKKATNEQEKLVKRLISKLS